MTQQLPAETRRPDGRNSCTMLILSGSRSTVERLHLVVQQGSTDHPVSAAASFDHVVMETIGDNDVKIAKVSRHSVVGNELVGQRPQRSTILQVHGFRREKTRENLRTRTRKEIRSDRCRRTRTAKPGD